MRATERFLGRVRRQFTLVFFGHILNWPFRNRAARRKRRYDATRRSTLNYLKRYVPHIKEINPRKPADMTPEPERVFTIWFQGERNAPPLVKACFASMRRHLKQELVVLDEENLFDWVDLPEYVIEKWRSGKLSAAHFSDICRVDLLWRHGGVWLDATAFVTQPIPEWIMDEDFFIYMAGSKIRAYYSFVQNCFIRSRKGNELISIWRDAILHYWEDETSVVNYFTHHFLFNVAVENNPVAIEAFAKMRKEEQDPTHALWDSHSGDPYDEASFKELTKDAFFQKTSYKSATAKEPPAGSVAEKLINSSR